MEMKQEGNRIGIEMEWNTNVQKKRNGNEMEIEWRSNGYEVEMKWK